MQVVDQQGRILKDQKVHNMEIYALQELLIALYYMGKLVPQQLLKGLQLITLLFQIFHHHCVKKRVLCVKKILRTHQQSIKPIIQHVPLLIVAGCFVNQFSEYP